MPVPGATRRLPPGEPHHRASRWGRRWAIRIPLQKISSRSQKMKVLRYANGTTKRPPSREHTTKLSLLGDERMLHGSVSGPSSLDSNQDILRLSIMTIFGQLLAFWRTLFALSIVGGVESFNGRRKSEPTPGCWETCERWDGFLCKSLVWSAAAFEDHMCELYR